MSTGETIAIVVAGVGVVGVGGYLLLRKGTSTPAAPVGVVAPAPPPPATPPVQQLANGLQAISNTGCAAVAGSKGIPSSIAKAGCSAYTKYLTPVGLTTVALNQVEKIPIVGTAVKKVENAVSTVVSKPIHAVENFLGSIF
ncbi:MAG TPA: hypothetical protein VIF11_15770 [Methylomirabilota bacterium]